MRKILLLPFLLTGCLALLSNSFGERHTTHRVGDPGMYRAGCHDAESMLAIAERDSRELWILLTGEGKCFTMRGFIGFVLVEFIDGPFKYELKDSWGSIWKIRDVKGDIEYIWVANEGGFHEAERDYDV